ncbi:hypothetical protein BDV3_002682 [Batrachochytrium dendrobatidis]|uniref:Disease resistance R13L4/SHOC-2-like LRR domain-containing protein n=2 Tax=Batrachochytrium dendrobatidis TaxID=109871 RepID=A0A177WW12_BATDL|nr:hypothetical protein O5D80_001674 [Batrachochytrium dendrobatidis]KAK5670481.1 hypothetical protein QVD99_003161 [Batrachochytrium dendrobatidis]OAJ44126.1 hypothetical protein BDEG_27391 [Batrachochytrium dendrobatidis JEL423]
MGNRLSKEQASVPFAYARDPTAVRPTDLSRYSTTGPLITNDPSFPSNSLSTAFPLDSGGLDDASVPSFATLDASPYSSGLDGIALGLPDSRAAIINANPIHKLKLVSEIDRDQDFLDSLPLIIPLLGNSCLEDRHAEERLARDPTVETLTFGQLPSLATIGACSQNLVAISRNIGLLAYTTTLQLCCNRLTSIPAEIGYLKNLVILSLAHNNLTELPDTIGLLTKLVQLKANNNALASIPEAICKLSKLETLQLECNEITHVPNKIGALSNLVTIDLSNNPLELLPAEVGRLKMLRRIGTSNCPLSTTSKTGDAVLPSLKELAARTIVRFQLPILSITQPELKDYLASAQECSCCGGPYFDTYTTHVRMVERSRTSLPLEYRLCTRHWSNDADRIKSLFAPLPATAPKPAPLLNIAFSNSLDSSDKKSCQARSDALPLSSIAKSPSLPTLPFSVESHSRKSSASKLFRKTAFMASGMRASRSLSFLSLQNGSAASSLP